MEQKQPSSFDFKTPEEVASTAFSADPDPVVPLHGGHKSSLKQRLKHLGTKGWLISALIIVGCASIVSFVISHIGNKPVAQATPIVASKKVQPAPKTVPSTLTGMPVDPSVNARPVTGVMIENSLDARPQSGLADAGVVFEAIAEGGITRFLALFQDTAPADVGPIRSARPYYVQWALGFDAGYAHVGGSPEALADIKAWGVKDLDQFHAAGSYHRIKSRAAPHNVYTSIAALNQLEASRGYNTSNYKGFFRKKAVPSKAPNVKQVNIGISGPLYNVHYDYNPATNLYQRAEAGKAHIDANGNHQITPSVVVALVMPYGLEADDHHSFYNTIGAGQAFIFQNGTLSIGSWSKPAATTQFSFTDAAGKPLGLNPGQTWITAVSAANKVTYAP
jgi:hypothetical protein